MFNPIQIILLVLLVAVWKYHQYNIQCFYYGSVVLVGVLAGLIMGNVSLGLTIGGSMCLMSLGLFGAGGSSVPDYQMGCIAGTAFACAMGLTGSQALTTGLTIGIPVAALGTELDVLGKTSGSFFIHKMMDASDKGDWKAMGRWMWLSQIPFLGLQAVPMLLLTTVGATYVQTVINSIPAWLNNGLNVAAGMLPALGFAMLLRQMPMKKYGYFILMGYVLAAYLGMSVLAITMLAVVGCAYIFTTLQEKDSAAAGTATAGGDFEDE